MKGFQESLAVVRGKISAYQTERRLKIYLALNENPYSFPQALIKKVYESIDPSKLGIYYDSPDEELLDLLVGYLKKDYPKVKKENVSIGNGADEIIYYLLLMFRGMKVVVFPPTYSCYELFAKAIGSEMTCIPLKSEKIPLDEIADKLDENCIVFLPNPNNPTGHFFSDEEIKFLLNTGALVVLDEAYYEFGLKSHVDWLETYKNLVVMRTFSKAFSLAAQRIGYLIANEDIIDVYNRIRLPFNVDYVSQLFAKIALKNLDIFKKRINKIINEREKMKMKLKELGYRISNSMGNFVFIYLDDAEKEKLIHAFENSEIAIRKFEEGLRITIGTPEQNEIVLKILGDERDEN